MPSPIYLFDAKMADIMERLSTEVLTAATRSIHELRQAGVTAEDVNTLLTGLNESYDHLAPTAYDFCAKHPPMPGEKPAAYKRRLFKLYDERADIDALIRAAIPRRSGKGG